MNSDIQISRPMRIIQWILIIAFGLLGLTKIIGTAGEVALFDRIGFGHGFRYFTGVLELVAAGLLLTRRGRTYGAALMVLIGCGAAVTQLFLGQFLLMLPPLGLVILALYFAAQDVKI